MELRDVKELYGAWISFPIGEKEIVFAHSPMEIEQRYGRAIVTKHPYFTNRNYSTKHFEEDMLEKEYRISETLRIFYSVSKEKCIEWLSKERERLIRQYRADLNRIKSSEITEKIEQF